MCERIRKSVKEGKLRGEKENEERDKKNNILERKTNYKYREEKE